jgi:hypothetical protein
VGVDRVTAENTNKKRLMGAKKYVFAKEDVKMLRSKMFQARTKREVRY